MGLHEPKSNWFHDMFIEEAKPALSNKNNSGGTAGPDVSMVTAAADHVLDGDIFVDKQGKPVTGTMPNNGELTYELSGIDTTTVDIPEGYTSGGTITMNGDVNNATQAALNAISEKGVTIPEDSDLRDVAGLIEAIEVGSGDSGGGDAVTKILDRTITEYSNNEVQTIGHDAFYTCELLTTVSFPAATLLGTSAFAYCYALTSMSFPAVTSIQGYVFAYCSALTSVYFPAATSIGIGAFYQCRKLTSVSLPAAITIDANAFAYCPALTSVYSPAATSIGNNAFSACSALTSAYFPAATSIGTSAFMGCHKLTDASFPAVTSISDYAFRLCTALTEASFPAAITLGKCAFMQCSAFSSLYLMGPSLCKLSSSNAFSTAGITSSTGTIYVPASLLTSYKAATNWTYFSTRIVAGDA